MVSRNCLKCGKPDYVALDHVPKIQCEFCDSDLRVWVKTEDKGNYWLGCNRCHLEWKLADVLPAWSELFEYSGLAAYGDYMEQTR